jgi:hypothetical protein
VTRLLDSNSPSGDNSDGSNAKPIGTLSAVIHPHSEYGKQLLVAGLRSDYRNPMLKGVRFKLHFGPYRAPLFKYGAVVEDALRGEVTIVGLSAGRIPWPIGQKGQSKGPVLFKGLAKAVRRESVVAVQHWWGVSFWRINGWRSPDAWLVLKRRMTDTDEMPDEGRSPGYFTRRNWLGEACSEPSVERYSAS